MADPFNDLLKRINVNVSDPLLPAKETAEILRVKEQTLAAWRFRHDHRLPWCRLGGRAIRYRMSDILKFIEDSRHA